eukprot:CAMPEP_0178898766 /NCGR_PEP_ID=MMETSP0786-20121207/2526_1 /TAXON_ID=186022 /ORGANISM="Thalassionema frauenfeldii, Strain CCMP 1798" /LENGTH=432 /DNA_ID=CAMNT_0020569547 /DNA_START=58 /DNA_END=1356 /DNA_ORIENTATION=+
MTNNFIVSFLQSLFADEMTTEDREPLYTFTFFEKEYGVLAPKLALWQQFVYMILIQVVFQVAAAIINYRFLVQPRRNKKRNSTTNNNNNNNNNNYYLLGWGVVIPLACWIPHGLLKVVHIGNRVVKLAAGNLANVVVFRTIEAMYDTSPHSVEQSLSNYITYYTSLVQFEWDQQTHTRKKMTGTELLQSIGMVLLFFHLSSLLLSFQLQHNFLYFLESPVTELHLYHFSLEDLFHWHHLANNYLLMLTIYAVLNFGFRFTALGEQLKGGYATKPIFLNPVFGTRSLSEFWGKRWNLTIHNILYRGAFLPLRRFVPTTIVAVFGTFVASGLLHDYAWSLTFASSNKEEEEEFFQPTFWKLTAFFLWNGAFMLLERPLGPLLYKYIGTYLPTILLSTLLGLTAVPVMHWYGGDWVTGGYFADLSLACWKIVPLE